MSVLQISKNLAVGAEQTGQAKKQNGKSTSANLFIQRCMSHLEWLLTEFSKCGWLEWRFVHLHWTNYLSDRGTVPASYGAVPQAVVCPKYVKILRLTFVRMFEVFRSAVWRDRRDHYCQLCEAVVLYENFRPKMLPYARR